MQPSTLKEALNFETEETALILPRLKSNSDAIKISYKKLLTDVSALQSTLASLEIGTRQSTSIVTLALPNSYELVVAFLAVSFQRATVSPVNPAYKRNELDFYMSDLSSALVLVPQHAYQQNTAAVVVGIQRNIAIAECYFNGTDVVMDLKHNGKLRVTAEPVLHEPQAQDVAIVLHTSGTTGNPKAVPLSHLNLVTSMKNISESCELTSKDRTILVMPLFHAHGLLGGLLSPLYVASSVILPYGGFKAGWFWSDFIKHGANWWTAVPTIHMRLLKTPIPEGLNQYPKIKFLRSCSSFLAPATLEELERTFKTTVIEAYAITEAASQVASNPLPQRGRRKPGSVGIPKGVDVRIITRNEKVACIGEEGEILIRGRNVTRGYLHNPLANEESFTKDGYFRTGDQGKRDEDGFLYVTGRIKELINRGGEKISPVEIDSVLAECPQVREATSFGIPDSYYGEIVGVAVVLSEGDKSFHEDSLKHFIGDKLSEFKLPEKIFIVDEIPKMASGKVQRKVVAEAVMRRKEPRHQMAKL